MTSIPLVDLGIAHREIESEVMEGFRSVLAATSFVGGKEVALFEQEYAEFLGVRHCVGVANGTDALEIALRAVGITAGDEVVLPANTFVATAEAVARLGARPLLVDVDDEHLLLDPEQLESRLTPGTRAIMPVHLYGQCAPVTQIREVIAGRDVLIIEDAAQAQGATHQGEPAGGLGLAAGTSFYPGKNLGAYGDAGALLTNDHELSTMARTISQHGSVVRYHHDLLGFNSRLDTLQAVVLRAKLTRLAGWNDARRAAAARYHELLSDVDGVRLPSTMSGNEHVWHLYVVRITDRDRVLARLNARGIGAAIHYPIPVHLHPAFSWLELGPGSMPVSESSAAQILSLPLYPGITAAQQERVAEELRAAVAED